MKKLLFVLLLTTPAFVFADATPTATITIRDGSTTAFTGVVELAASTTAPIDIAPSNSSSTVSVAADSLLATLVALDATTTDFDITDLEYFSSFNSFIINCISIPTSSTTHCFNWTYAVNGTFPQIGTDDQTLHDGDVVHLFFGPSRQTVLSTRTVTSGESFTATAQRYDLDSGAYVGQAGVTLGVGTANPDYSFTEIATSTTDALGEAIFTLNATGTFSVGIQEDYYFPTVSITIVDAATEAESPADNPPPTGGGGEGPVHLNFNVPTALSYLATTQQPDGSFGSSLYTDWVALAFAAAHPGEPRERLRNYLLTASPTFSSVTDYERHAMALMALGINPYSGTPVDYITPIVNAFDGTQIGDPHLDNDDIFGIFALMSAGYSPSDPIIQKVAAFILSAQNPNGSWDNSPDMTAAAAQAVGSFFGTPGIQPLKLGQSLSIAAGYLASKQLPDGGWGNIDSTSWVQMMISAMNQADPTRASTWTSSGGLYPMDAIANAQQVDGAVHPTSDTADKRTWSTSYAVTAASGKHWLSIMQKFSKPPTSQTTSGSGGIWVEPATSSPTVIATTTPLVSTSTPEVLGMSTSTIANATSSIVTTTKPVSPKPTLKKKVAKKIAPVQKVSTSTKSTPTQTATAITPKSGFFSTLWRSIASFVASLF